MAYTYELDEEEAESFAAAAMTSHIKTRKDSELAPLIPAARGKASSGYHIIFIQVPENVPKTYYQVVNEYRSWLEAEVEKEQASGLDSCVEFVSTFHDGKFGEELLYKIRQRPEVVAVMVDSAIEFAK